VRLVLVHGARPQIESRLARRGIELRYVNGLRVTDDEALSCVKEAAGVARVEIEALLSMGLANSPMAGVRIPVASGNFVTAKPLGVLDGVDFQHTGVVRRVDRQALIQRLDDGAVALMPPIGYSPTGEVFNLSAADVARSAAIALKADKLIFLIEEAGVTDPERGTLISNVLSGEVSGPARPRPDLPEDLCPGPAGRGRCLHPGVQRAHLIDRRIDGALLRELYTRDGSGTLITASPYEDLRPARSRTSPASWSSCAPWRSAGSWSAAPRERLETEIDRFWLMERDGTGDRLRRTLPLPCRRHGGARLRGRPPGLPPQTRAAGDKLLQSHGAPWPAPGVSSASSSSPPRPPTGSRSAGSSPAPRDALPMERQALYNWRRNSLVFIKTLDL
jgi:amino-acid N-acetyltransferase